MAALGTAQIGAMETADLRALTNAVPEVVQKFFSNMSVGAASLLMGTKTVLNEFVAYLSLAKLPPEAARAFGQEAAKGFRQELANGVKIVQLPHPNTDKGN